MLGSREHTDYAVDHEDWQQHQWIHVGIRVAPILLVIALVAAVWPSTDGDGANGSEIAAIRTDTTLSTVAVAERASVADGSFTNEPLEQPQLFVQGTALGQDTDAQNSTTSSQATTSTSEADGSTSNSAASSQTPAAGNTPPNSAPQSDGSSTTAVTTTQSSQTTNTTTAPPATQTTATPTTTPPTTAAPTTAITSAPTTQPPNSGNCNSNSEFERVFRDDFNGSSLGGSWSEYNGPGNRNFGLRSSSANSVADGKLIITAKMENGQLVSGGMRHSLDQKYGKFVVRVRTDNDPSQSVSGVVLTWPESGSKLVDGENNIYETLVKTPNRDPFYTFIHKPNGTHATQESYGHFADGSQFQTMTMEWTPSRITIIREGPGRTSRDEWQVNETSSNLIPDVKHHLAIQLDGWKHTIGGTVRLEVDFVEIHKYCG